MDSIKTQKLEAMKNYKRAQFLYNVIVYSLTAFLSCLFYLYLFWFPSASMNHFFLFLVPSIYSLFILSPNKLLFIVGNLIVLFLVGESKLRSGSQYSSSPADEIYNEYVRRSQSISERSFSSSTINDEQRKNGNRIIHRKKNVKMDNHAARVDSGKKKKLEKVENGGEFEGVKYAVVDDLDDELVRTKVPERLGSVQEEEHGVLLPRDELKKRVEDFIARVNRQRMLEEITSRC